MDEKPDKRPRRTKSEVDAHVQRWRASGQSIRDFSIQHALPSSSLYQWVAVRGGRKAAKSKRSTSRQRRTTGAPSAKAVTAKPEPEFSELNVVLGTKPHSEITITTAAGHMISLEGDAVDIEVLRLVLETVKAC